MNITTSKVAEPGGNTSKTHRGIQPSDPSHNSHASHSSHPITPPAPQAPAKNPDFPHFPHSFLKKSSRADDRIAHLPPEDQQQIVHWFSLGLTYAKIIELAAKPRPDGLDLKLSFAVLCRFYHKHNLAEKIEDAAQLVASICPENAPNPEAAFEILAQTHALHTMASPDLDHAAFQQITRFLLRQEDQRIRQRALDLKQKRLAFDLQHKHYDIFKKTIEKLPEINQLVADEALDPVERLNRHLDEMFGCSLGKIVKEGNRKYREQYPDEPSSDPQIDPHDFIPPLTPEQEQAAVNEAFDVMLGPQHSAHSDQSKRI